MNFTTIYIVIYYVSIMYIQNKEKDFKKEFVLCT